MIDFINVVKTLGGRSVLDGVSFRINQGERIGVTGPNGTGKTTLFNLICGDMTPDKGEILIPERLRIGILRQQLEGRVTQEQDLISYVSSTDGSLSRIHERILELEARLAERPSDEKSLEEIGLLQSQYEQLGGYDMGHRAAAALSGLGFPESVFRQPLSSFSGGWQMRASMARVLLGEPDILLLDEPSNYLDVPAVEWLQKRLKNYAGTLLLVSHDRFLLNTLTNVTLEVNGGCVTRYPCNYAKYVTERELRHQQAEAERKNLQKRRETLEANIARFRYKASKAAQVQMWIKQLDRLEETKIPEALHFQGRIRIPEPPRCGPEVASVEQLSHTYDGERWIFRDVSFSVRNGEKLGIVGYNGMGKTTLLRIIAGSLKPTSGRCRLGHNVVVGYQAQEFAELLPPEQSAFDVVKQASGGACPPSRIREILGAFGFSGDAAMKQCKVLSGGEKIRLCFARIFVNPPNLLVLDEPTTHLDIAANEALQHALADYAGTVILVSHDIEFLRGSADSILEMKNGSVRKFYGNFDYYKEKTDAEAQAEKKASTASAASSAQSSAPTSARSEAPSSSAPVRSSRERRQEKAQLRNQLLPRKRRLEKEIAKLEKRIEAAEQEKETITAQLSTPGPDIDYAGLQKRLKALDYDISRDTLEWESLAEELEAFQKEYAEALQ